MLKAMTGESEKNPVDQEGLKGLLDACRADLTQERQALYRDIARAAEALAHASSRNDESQAFDKAMTLVRELEAQFGRLEQSVNALEKLFQAPNRLDRIFAKLESLHLEPHDAVHSEEALAIATKDGDGDSINPEALLDPAQPDAGVIDLQNAMVQRLRNQVERLREERGVLIINGRNTLASMIRVHQAILGLLSASSYQDFLERLNTELPHIIDIRVVVLGIERSGPVAVTPELSNIRLLPDGKVEELFGSQHKLLLRPNVSGDRHLYGEHAKDVCSDALVRLEIPGSDYAGVLAFGAEDPDYFSDDQGTELLTFLGRSIETLIGKWTDRAI